MTCRVHLTVDVEVWPVHGGGWPRVPLDAGYDCRREIRAFLWGDTAIGAYGLPYQLQVLERHDLKATYFVDPMFSFALGIEPLREIISLIQGQGQRVELHLHPEWLTDPRCPPIASFAGPMIGAYTEDVQYRLICTARERLQEAGAQAPTAFRAGGWGAALSTLRALERAGLRVDASLNANSPTSLPDLVDRERLQRPVRLGSIVEIPLTRFDDGMTPAGRPLSCVGASFDETSHVLEVRRESGSPCAVAHATSSRSRSKRRTSLLPSTACVTSPGTQAPAAAGPT